MRIFFSSYFSICVLCAITLCSRNTAAEGWTQFRGSDRDGKSSETGLLDSWPQEGPELLWSFTGLGSGFSSASISGKVIYITGVENKQEVLFALDHEGRLLWKTDYGPAWKGSYPEPRTTPTIDGEFIYVVSGMGQVVCLSASNGEIRWTVHAVDKFKGKYHSWGIAESPLIVDDKVICTPGGKNATIVALDKRTGDTVWTSKGLSDKGNYCSPILVQRGGNDIIVSMVETAVVGIDAKTGAVLWRDEFKDYQDKPKDINPTSPVYHDGCIYTTSGYDDGGALYELSEDGKEITRKWTDRILDNHIGGVVVVDGYIYGSNWEDNRNGNWVCLDWNTGKLMWEKKWFNKGPIVYADGKLYCFEEKDGHVGLIQATPDRFFLKSSFQITRGRGPFWAHPSICDGRLYLRHGDVLMVYDIDSR